MHPSQQAAFLRCVAPLLASPQVQSMKQWRHHFSITCYEHSLFVSYTAFAWPAASGWDERAAAGRGCSTTCTSMTLPTAPPIRATVLRPPVAALRNARELCPDLTEREANAILTHMFPLSAHLPRCREAAVVNLADKICATIEVAHLYRTRFVQRRLPVPAPA